MMLGIDIYVLGIEIFLNFPKFYLNEGNEPVIKFYIYENP